MLSLAALSGIELLGFADSASTIQAKPTATPKAKVKAVSQITFTDGEYDGQAVAKTDADWKKLLGADAFYVLRNEGTEKPYTGSLLKNKKAGTYHLCGLRPCSILVRRQI